MLLVDNGDDTLKSGWIYPCSHVDVANLDDPVSIKSGIQPMAENCDWNNF
jgi:hypothetical protein